MLGKLTRYLRMMGYDVVYASDIDAETDQELINAAEESNRRIITRDKEIASKTDAILLKSKDINNQLRELITAGVELRLDYPTRCSLCNSELHETDENPEHAPSQKRVWECSGCGQYYWKGSHWFDVQETLRDIRNT